jgi:hypothetical protein
LWTAGGRRKDAVDLAIVQLVRLASDDTWTAGAAAIQLRDHVHDETVLRCARSRVGWALAERSSIIGERAAATLDAALAWSRGATATSPDPRSASHPAMISARMRALTTGAVAQDSLAYPATPWRVLGDDTPVKVRSWIDGTWEAGFEIAGVVAEANGIVGYRVRRVSDAAVLPAWVSIHEVMPDRHGGRA